MVQYNQLVFRHCTVTTTRFDLIAYPCKNLKIFHQYFYLQTLTDNEDFYNAGIRYKDMKLLLGNPGKMDGWYPPPQVMDISKDDYEIQQLTELFKSSEFSLCEKNSVRLYNLTSDPSEKGCRIVLQTF